MGGTGRKEGPIAGHREDASTTYDAAVSDDPNRTQTPWDAAAHDAGPGMPPTAEGPPDAVPPDAGPPPPDDPTTRTEAPSAPGLISAEPVGWTVPPAFPTSEAPVTGWSLPTAVQGVSLGGGLLVAGTWVRAFAYLFDAAILSSISIIAAVLFGAYDARLSDDAVLMRATAAGVLTLLIDGLYFVTLWRMPGQGTLGMRLLRLRVVNRQDGGTLTVRAALIRWFALSGGIGLLTLLPSRGGTGLSLSVVWVIILVVSTASHPLRQGFHDRVAGSVVGRPAGAGNGVAVVGCLALLLIFGIVPIVLLAASPELRDVIEEIGRSV